jgi:flagellar biosynthesis protein FliQ
MESGYFIGIAQQALWVLALGAAPILVPALVAGIILGMVQAATSINEATLSFVPKLMLVGVCLALFGSTIMMLLTDFTREMFNQIPTLVG